jgi:hypothetical protein
MIAVRERGVRELFRGLMGRAGENVGMLLPVELPGIGELRSQALSASAATVAPGRP